MPDRLFLTNVGSFLPGSVERIIQQDAPQEIHRNPALAKAMVNLNMIDTQGGGIKRMFQTQMKRYFPMPHYDLSNPERVAVTIRGTIMNENYTSMLMNRTDLDLWAVILLDKVQKGIQVERNDHRQLKQMGLVEGRYPNLVVSAKIANVIGQKAEHIRTRGLGRKYYNDMIYELIQRHGPIMRKDVDRLLIDKLPEILSLKKKSAMIHNLLTALRKKNLIENIGTRKLPQWVCAKKKQ